MGALHPCHTGIPLNLLSPPMRVAVVTPCYRVKAHIVELCGKHPSTVDRMFAVDDAFITRWS